MARQIRRQQESGNDEGRELRRHQKWGIRPKNGPESDHTSGGNDAAGKQISENTVQCNLNVFEHDCLGGCHILRQSSPDLVLPLLFRKTKSMLILSACPLPAVEAEKRKAHRSRFQLRLALRQALPGNDLRLPVIWTSYQFPLPLPSCNLKLSQSKVKT